MKFSYYLPCYYTDKSKPASELYAEAEYQAQYAEELGYDAIVIPEHYFMNYLACPNLLMFAVRISQLVKLRIMSAVIPIPLYHPLDWRRTSPSPTCCREAGWRSGSDAGPSSTSSSGCRYPVTRTGPCSTNALKS